MSVNHSGSYGISYSGSFSNSTRPVSILFPSGSGHDWTGSQTSYTASPFDCTGTPL